LDKCFEDFCVEGAEVVDARGKLVNNDKCVKVLKGKGEGYLKLKPTSNKVKIGSLDIPVKELRVYARVEKAWLGVTTDVELVFEGSPGTVEYEGFVYGVKVKDKVVVPGSSWVKIRPKAPGGYLELLVHPRTLVQLALPKPVPPIDEVVPPVEAYFGLPASFVVRGKPDQSFEVVAYGTKAEGITDEEGFGKTTLIPKERTDKAIIKMEEFELKVNVPPPEEPFEIRDVELRGTKLYLKIRSKVISDVEVTVKGTISGNLKTKLLEGDHELEVPLENLPPFSKRMKALVIVRMGEFTKELEVEGEVSGVARVVIFDGKNLWIHSKKRTRIGTTRLEPGVNVIRAPIKTLELLKEIPCPGQFDSDLILTIKCGKCIRIIDEKDGSVCHDETLNYVSVHRKTVLGVGATSSIVVEPDLSIKRFQVGGRIGVIGSLGFMVCGERCKYVSLDGKTVKTLPYNLEKIEGPYGLANNTLYLIEGDLIKPVAETDDFSYCCGKVALLKDHKATVDDKSFVVDGKNIALGRDLLLTYTPDSISIYSLEGDLLYKKRMKVREAKLVDDTIIISDSEGVYLYTPVPETFEEPLFTLADIPVELRKEKCLRFIVENYEDLLVYKDCFFENPLPLTPRERLEACKLFEAQPEYKELVDRPELFDKLHSLWKYLSLSTLLDKGGMLSELAREIMNKALPLRDFKLYKLIIESRSLLESPSPNSDGLQRLIEELRKELSKIEKPRRRILRRLLECRNVGDLVNLLEEERIKLDELKVETVREIRYPEDLFEEAQRTLERLEGLAKLVRR